MNKTAEHFEVEPDDGHAKKMLQRIWLIKKNFHDSLKCVCYPSPSPLLRAS